MDVVGIKNLTNIFRLLLEEFPDAIIAGGAIRDALLDKKIKDIDVWGDMDIPEHKWEGSVDITECETKIEGAVIISRLYCPYPINLIKLSPKPTVWQILERFDYDLCRVAYSKNGPLITDAFLNDVRKKCLTHNGKNHTSLARYVKLCKKFYDWHVDVPSNLT